MQVDPGGGYLLEREVEPVDHAGVQHEGHLAGEVALAERHRLDGQVRERPSLVSESLAGRRGERLKRLRGDVPPAAEESRLADRAAADPLELFFVDQVVDDRLADGVGDDRGGQVLRQVLRRAVED